MSLETLRLLRSLLENSTLVVGAPDFLVSAAIVVNAVTELNAAIAAAEAAEASHGT